MFGNKKLKKIKQVSLNEIEHSKKIISRKENDDELDIYDAFHKGRKSAFESILRIFFKL